MAIYPVDARGLIGIQALAANRSGINLGSGLNPPWQNFDTMDTLARRTSGRAFYNTNDIKGAVRAAIEDSRVTYLLGYYPTHGQWDGKFREIKVKVDRPGLQLHYRRGYLAMPADASTEAQRKASLSAAVWGPLDPTSVGVTVQAQAIPGGAPDSATLLLVEVDPKDITLQPRNDRWVGSIDFLFAQLDAAGQDLHHDSNILNMNLTRPSYEKFVQVGLGLKQNIRIAPGTYQVRVVVRDGTSSALGAVSVPVNKVPAGPAR